MRTFAYLVLVMFAACGKDEGPTMRPGEDCTSCHGFKVAGTVFPSASADATEGVANIAVTLVDSAQQTITLTSNSAGNFYTEQKLAWPATVSLTQGAATVTMAMPLTGGACNSCHKPGGIGRIHLP